MSVNWTPQNNILGTFKEDEDFIVVISATIQSEQNNQTVNLYVTGEFIGGTPENVVFNNIDSSLIVEGNTGFHFNDRLHLLMDDYTYKNLSTITDSPKGKSVWDKAEHEKTLQVVGFYPDMVRYKEFNFVANAHSFFGGAVVDTKNFKIVVFDPNWETGKNQLKSFLGKIKNNDRNSN